MWKHYKCPLFSPIPEKQQRIVYYSDLWAERLEYALQQVYQRIDIVSRELDNIVDLRFGTPWPLLPLEVTATLAHTFELTGTRSLFYSNFSSSTQEHWCRIAILTKFGAGGQGYMAFFLFPLIYLLCLFIFNLENWCVTCLWH